MQAIAATICVYAVPQYRYFRVASVDNPQSLSRGLSLYPGHVKVGRSSVPDCWARHVGFPKQKEECHVYHLELRRTYLVRAYLKESRN